MIDDRYLLKLCCFVVLPVELPRKGNLKYVANSNLVIQYNLFLLSSLFLGCQ